MESVFEPGSSVVPYPPDFFLVSAQGVSSIRMAYGFRMLNVATISGSNLSFGTSGCSQIKPWGIGDSTILRCYYTYTVKALAFEGRLAGSIRKDFPNEQQVEHVCTSQLQCFADRRTRNDE